MGSSLRAILAGLCQGTLALLSSELAPLLTSWEPSIRFIFHLAFPTSEYLKHQSAGLEAGKMMQKRVL